MWSCLRKAYTTWRLKHATYANTPAFLPDIRRGKVVRVYDGDTLHLAFLVHGKPQRIRVRLAGFDCAEMRSSHAAEKAVALRSKQRLEQQVLGRLVQLHQPLRWDKYGRLLADISTPQIPRISQWMIAHADGIPYHGGTKAVVDWDKRL